MKGKKEGRLKKLSEGSKSDVVREERIYSFNKSDLLLYVGLLVFSMIICYVCVTMLIGNGAYTYSEDIYRNIEKAVKTHVTPEGGIDDVALYDCVDECYSGCKNGEIKLVCIIRNGGFFKAKVTTKFTKKYEKIDTNRNFATHDRYMLHFYGVYGVCLIVGTFVLWILIIFAFNMLANVVSGKNKNKRRHNTEETSIPDVSGIM